MSEQGNNQTNTSAEQALDDAQGANQNVGQQANKFEEKLQLQFALDTVATALIRFHRGMRHRNGILRMPLHPRPFHP